MSVGEIIILAVYGIGYLIIFFYQKSRIKNLEGKIVTTKDISELMERYTKMLDLDRVEKYVQLSEKTFRMETEHYLKKLESVMYKEFVKHWKEIPKQATDFLEDLFTFSFNVFFLFGYHPKLNEFAEKIENEQLKKEIRKVIENLKKRDKK